MANNRKTADKFRVGQTVAFVLDRETGHAQHNGKLTRILGQREFGEWHCADPAEPARGACVQRSWRYRVVMPGDGSAWRPAWYVTQEMLRPVYDGEPLSTWEKFAKKTGIRIDAPILPRKIKQPS